MLQNKKSLGQHWLKSRPILNHIADLAATPVKDPSTFCLEIGPGLGTLTSSLLRLFSSVIAIEYDQKLAANLPKSFPGKNLTVITSDFLQFNLESLPSTPYVVAANIPYYITSPIIKKLLTSPRPPLRIVLLIQKEVAQRLAASPGKHTYASIFASSHSTVSLSSLVPRELFTPPPKVDSQIIILDPLPAPLLDPAALKLAHQGFLSPRKKLIKNLPYPVDLLHTSFEALKLSPDVRPAALSISDWQKLSELLRP